MASLPDCAAIVLAAGASSRLGTPKQLVQCKGESLLRRSVRAATDAGCNPVIVVVGYYAARMRMEISDMDATCIENSEWRSGMASSVRAGINAAMLSSPSIQNVLLMVCDQPFVNAALLTELIRKALPADAPAACRYAGVLGVPAVFPQRMWPRLLALKGDEGARRVLANYENVVTVGFSAGAIDVDTPEILSTLEK